MRLRIDLAYDGGAFYGWAVQPDIRTVQGEVESALRRILRVAACTPAIRSAISTSVRMSCNAPSGI